MFNLAISVYSVFVRGFFFFKYNFSFFNFKKKGSQVLLKSFLFAKKYCIMHVGNKLVVNTVGWGCIIFLVSSYMEHNIFVFLVYFETKCRTTQTLGLILVWGILIVTSPRGSPARDNTYVKYGANLVLFFSCLDKVHKQALSNGLKLSASLILLIVVHTA